jgi:hypothetical protein
VHGRNADARWPVVCRRQRLQRPRDVPARGLHRRQSAPVLGWQRARPTAAIPPRGASSPPSRAAPPDDGNACNGSEVCQGNTCTPGTPLSSCPATCDTTAVRDRPADRGPQAPDARRQPRGLADR